MTKFCCSAINLALKGNVPEYMYDPEILQMQDEVFFKNDPVLIVDTCLIIITCMSYIIPQRKDLLAIFRETFTSNLDKLLVKPVDSEAD